jgi:hypothetical protein
MSTREELLKREEELRESIFADCDSFIAREKAKQEAELAELKELALDRATDPDMPESIRKHAEYVLEQMAINEALRAHTDEALKKI